MYKFKGLKKITNKINNKAKAIPMTKEEIKQDKIKKLEEKKIINDKNKKDAQIINKLVRDFMDTLGALEINNQESIGYSLNNIEVHEYGLSARIYAPYGMTLSDLEKYTPLIETGCKCQFIFEIPQHKQFAMAEFIYPEQVKINEWVFKPVKVLPWQFCPGYGIDGKPIIFNINIFPQILDAGMQRRGKNGAADHAIVNWIYSCDETEITFYMFQCARNDLIKYKNCKQVYCYADTLDDILIALEHIEEEYHRRVKLFEPMVAEAENHDNIYHYNTLHPYNKLPYIIVVIDEFIELMIDSTIDSRDLKIQKASILKHIRQIGQFGGSLGINYLILHQKPSALLMPSFIKNQSSIRICFGFDDLVCCEIVLGANLAKYAYRLPPRKAFYSNSDSNGFLYTPNLKGQIKKYIQSSIAPNHRTLFGDLEKLNAKPEVEVDPIEDDTENEVEDKGTAPLPKSTKAKQTEKNNTEKVEPLTKQEILLRNIKKIPDFVPYNPSALTVIDQTNIFTKNNKEE